MEYIGFGKDDVEYDEEPEDGLRETETVPEERKKSTERRVLSTGNVVSLPGVNCGKMIVYRPVSYEDTQNIIDNLKGRKPVIVNMEQIEVETAQRILDFMSGACYAVDGRLYKVSARIFLVAPANYDIIGSSDGFRELCGCFASVSAGLRRGSPLCTFGCIDAIRTSVPVRRRSNAASAHSENRLWNVKI